MASAGRSNARSNARGAAAPPTAFAQYYVSRQIAAPTVLDAMDGAADHLGDYAMMSALRDFAPKVHAMMDTICSMDAEATQDRAFGARHLEVMRKRYERKGAYPFGSDRPPVLYLRTHFIFLPTADGDTLFGGKKDALGRLACAPAAGPNDKGGAKQGLLGAAPNDQWESRAHACLGTIAYAMRAYGVRVIPTDPRVRAGIAVDERNKYYARMGLAVGKGDGAMHDKLKRATSCAAGGSRQQPSPDCRKAVADVHAHMANQVRTNLASLLKVMGGMGGSQEYGHGDAISHDDCRRACLALGGTPQTAAVLQKVAAALSERKSDALLCTWHQRVRAFPEGVLRALDQENERSSNAEHKHRWLDRYRGMMDSRHNKAAFQFFLEVIHAGVVDEAALAKGKAVVLARPELACNYKRAILYTDTVVPIEKDWKRLFVHPLNQDGLLIRVIAVNLPRAVGLNIKPADVIHKPDLPEDDSTDIQSSARAMRACPFHYANLSECIVEQPGGAHRRCDPAQNMVRRVDYQFPAERGLERLRRQRQGAMLLKEVLAEYAVDCRDHQALHARKAAGGGADAESVLQFVKAKVAGGNGASSRSIPGCLKVRKDRQQDARFRSARDTVVSDGRRPHLAIVRHMPMPTHEFLRDVVSAVPPAAGVGAAPGAAAAPFGARIDAAALERVSSRVDDLRERVALVLHAVSSGDVDPIAPASAEEGEGAGAGAMHVATELGRAFPRIGNGLSAYDVQHHRARGESVGRGGSVRPTSRGSGGASRPTTSAAARAGVARAAPQVRIGELPRMRSDAEIPRGASVVVFDKATGRFSHVEHPPKFAGMNTREAAQAVLGNGTLKRMQPWMWSCPLNGQGLQSHQWTGAIASTHLANPRASTNPTKRQSGYVPTAQLVYHSAGSGKTLLMLLTTFLWMTKWWARAPSYYMPAQAGSHSARAMRSPARASAPGMPRLIIFVSELEQVRAMRDQDGLNLFISIMNDVVSGGGGSGNSGGNGGGTSGGNGRARGGSASSDDDAGKFRAMWSTYLRSLPDRKVVLRFTSDDSDLVRQGGLAQLAARDRSALIKGYSQSRPMAVVGRGPHHRLVYPCTGAMLAMIQGRSTAVTPVPKAEQWQPTAAFQKYHYMDVYLKLLTYAFAVLQMRRGGKGAADRADAAASKAAYDELRQSGQRPAGRAARGARAGGAGAAGVYGDHSVGMGSYKIVVMGMALQQFTEHTQGGSARLSVHGNQYGIGGPEVKDMTLWYKGHKRPGRDDDEMLAAVCADDFVRFYVKGSLDMDFAALEVVERGERRAVFSEEPAQLGGEQWSRWSAQNVGGVSPLFKVLKVKKVTYTRKGERKQYTHIELQRLLMHPSLARGAPLDPVFSTDITEVSAIKASESADRRRVMSSASNLRRGFAIYDIFRPSKKQLPSDGETLFDDAGMTTSQQTLPDRYLSGLLQRCGARVQTPASAGRVLSGEQRPKRTDDQRALTEVGLGAQDFWWLPYGTHPSFLGMTQDERARFWSRLTNSGGGAQQQQHADVDPPVMPNVLMLGMTSQMALQLFDRFPDDAFFIVDEVQKYIGLQDMPSDDPLGRNGRLERESLYCKLSEAVKPKETNGRRAAEAASPSSGGEAYVEDYDELCKGVRQRVAKARREAARAHADDYGEARRVSNLERAAQFVAGGGGGFIQVASATPMTVNLSTPPGPQLPNELERLFRMAGQRRDLRVRPVQAKMIAQLARAKDSYRVRMESLLRDAGMIVSFVDLGMDPTRVPASTARGNNRRVLTHFVKDVRARVRPENLGTGKTCEGRIGYPQMRAAVAAAATAAAANDSATARRRPSTKKAAPTTPQATKAKAKKQPASRKSPGPIQTQWTGRARI